ncbi:MAG TPA: tryptophan synthase subunit alpha [Vicinamibacterales bacterium]|jgi:tryptophan synthase alpha chain|nr:tryptophan synthase subunit alpha [Vicinamibacterales bacterium]
MNSSRIADAFARLRVAKQRGLVAYVTAGDPTLERTAEILVSLADSGADVLEVGVPFSDPLADGPVIQRASERALKSGTSLKRTLKMIRDNRSRIAAPIVLFTYANPILRMGEDVFVAAAADAGVDGVLMLDLPVEEAGPFRTRLAAAGLDPIFLLSPTTSDERIRASAANATGFLYVISRLGVTGARDRIASDAEPLVARIRRASDLPLALGFGISRPEHVSEVCRFADAAVVGSALVNVIAEHGASPDVAGKAGAYLRWLKGLA